MNSRDDSVGWIRFAEKSIGPPLHDEHFIRYSQVNQDWLAAPWPTGQQAGVMYRGNPVPKVSQPSTFGTGYRPSSPRPSIQCRTHCTVTQSRMHWAVACGRHRDAGFTPSSRRGWATHPVPKVLGRECVRHRVKCALHFVTQCIHPVITMQSARDCANALGRDDWVTGHPGLGRDKLHKTATISQHKRAGSNSLNISVWENADLASIWLRGGVFFYRYSRSSIDLGYV